MEELIGETDEFLVWLSATGELLVLSMTGTPACLYRLAQKSKPQNFPIALPNIDPFSKFFHCCIL